MKKKWVALVMTAAMVCAAFLPGTAFAGVSGTPGHEIDRQDSHGTGYLPSKKKPRLVDPSGSGDKGAARKGNEKEASFPSAYRSDEEPWAKNIKAKDQGETNLCWAFQTVSSVEYNYAKELYERTGEVFDDEFSPGHFAQFFFFRTNDPLGNTGGDSNSWGSTLHFTLRGNSTYYMMQHLATWSGIASESVAPLQAITDHLSDEGKWDGSPNPYSDDLAYGHNVAVVEESSYFMVADPENLKQIVQKYGACGVSMRLDTQQYMNMKEINPETGEPYKYGRSFYNHNLSCNQNHIVTLIGWDDNYPKENFSRQIRTVKTDKDGKMVYENDKLVYETKEIMPEKDGAWIMQNSWGEDSHENGIFYASYESADFRGDNCDILVLDTQPQGTYDYNFMYDGTAGCADTSDPSGTEDHQPFWTSEGTRAANVYTNTTGHPISLEAIGYTELAHGLTESDVSVYTGLTDPQNPMSGTFQGTTRISSTSAGCKTARLDQPVIVDPGETYSIVFTFGGDAAFGYESGFNDDDIIIFRAQIAPGQSFYRPAGEGNNWKDMADYDACFRIKGFANAYRYDLTGKTIRLSKAKYTYNKQTQKPQIITIDGRKLKEGTDYTAKWSNVSSRNAGKYSVSITGKGDWRGTAKASYEITKAVNPLKITKKKPAIISRKALKKKAQTLAPNKFLTLSGQQGAVTYKKISGNKGITITAGGKVKLKKGLKRNTYTFKVKIRAAGNANYQPMEKTVSLKVTV